MTRIARCENALVRRILNFDSYILKNENDGAKKAYRDIVGLCKNLNKEVPTKVKWNYSELVREEKEKGETENGDQVP